MQLLTPFVKKFKTEKNYYIYDVNSNKILQVNETVFDIVDYIDRKKEEILKKYKHKYSISNINKNLELINRAKTRDRILSTNRPNISFGYKSMNDIKCALNSNLSHLVLELTERCNQSCKYCGVSGKYSHIRANGKKDMSFETAKKAIDFFMIRSKKKLSIGFYGGEPLLRFDFIKEVIEYVKDKKPKEYEFTFTTNGTLFKEKMIKYFSKNNVSILISLDGPKHIHNRYRVFKNGRGTFNAILNNLKKIKKISPEFFTNKISYNAVLAPPYDFESIEDFFYKSPFFELRQDHILYSAVDTHETTFFDDFKLEDDERKIHKEILKLRNRYKNALIKGTYNDLTIEKQLFNKDFSRINNRPMDLISNEFAPQGTCFPGTRKLFVNVDGNFYMCERVNSNYAIGNVNYGFSYKRIYNFFKKYEELFKDCKYCWALRLCMKCFNNIRNGDSFSEARKEKLCINSLDKIENNLLDFCEIRETNAEAFKPFKNIVYG